MVQQVVLGGGIGLDVPLMTSSLMDSVDRARSGLASGTLSTTRQPGSMLGVAVFGSLTGSMGGFVAGFQVALAASIGLVVVGMQMALPIGRPERARGEARA